MESEDEKVIQMRYFYFPEVYVVDKKKWTSRSCVQNDSSI